MRSIPCVQYVFFLLFTEDFDGNQPSRFFVFFKVTLSRYFLKRSKRSHLIWKTSLFGLDRHQRSSIASYSGGSNVLADMGTELLRNVQLGSWAVHLYTKKDLQTGNHFSLFATKLCLQWWWFVVDPLVGVGNRRKRPFFDYIYKSVPISFKTQMFFRSTGGVSREVKNNYRSKRSYSSVPLVGWAKRWKKTTWDEGQQSS